MDTLYRFIVYLHVASAVFSIGPFIILIPIIKKLHSADTNVQQAYVDIIRFTVRLVKHAGHVLVGSGILLIALGPWTWKTSWVIATLIVMFGSIFFLARAYTPTLRVFFEPKQEQSELVKRLSWSSWLYLILLLLMLWFMVAKPVLW